MKETFTFLKGRKRNLIFSVSGHLIVFCVSYLFVSGTGLIVQPRLAPKSHSSCLRFLRVQIIMCLCHNQKQHRHSHFVSLFLFYSFLSMAVKEKVQCPQRPGEVKADAWKSQVCPQRVTVCMPLHIGVSDTCCNTWLLFGHWRSNSGPYGCVANILFTEPFISQFLNQ